MRGFGHVQSLNKRSSHQYEGSIATQVPHRMRQWAICKTRPQKIMAYRGPEWLVSRIANNSFGTREATSSYINSLAAASNCSSLRIGSLWKLGRKITSATDLSDEGS
jgi:hypothetical protein